jgi:hypothetical protein
LDEYNPQGVMVEVKKFSVPQAKFISVSMGKTRPARFSSARAVTSAGGGRLIDAVLLPLFKGILGLVKLVEEVSPIESLSTGRSITWGQLGGAFARIVLLLGGILSLAGIGFFTRRELAATQAQS